jgi:Spy/CpxP family protein refolding chaperone
MSTLPTAIPTTPPSGIKQLLIAAGLSIGLPCVAALTMVWPLFAHGEAPPDGNMHCAAPMVPPGSPDHGRPMGDMFPRGGMPPPTGMMPDAGPMPPFLLGLTLTETQQDKIFAIVHATVPLLREQGKLVRKNADRLRELTVSAEYDEAKLKALADAGARAMAEITLVQARSTHQIFALLSPEQRAQADAMKAKFEARFDAHQGIRAQIEEMKPMFDHPPGAATK